MAGRHLERVRQDRTGQTEDHHVAERGLGLQQVGPEQARGILRLDGPRWLPARANARCRKAVPAAATDPLPSSM